MSNKWVFNSDIQGGEDAVRHLNEAARALRQGDNNCAASSLERAAQALSATGFNQDARLKGVPSGFRQMRLVKCGRVVKTHPNGQCDVQVGDAQHPYERVGIRLCLQDKVKEGHDVLLRFFNDDPQMPFVDGLLDEFPWK